MALGTITVIQKTQHDGLNHDIISFAGDSAYATGGSASFTAAVRKALGKGNVQVLYVIPQDTAGKTPVYDQAADKLKIYSGATEASAGDQSASTYRLVVVSQ
jgi:hypothetical protein